jgi:hypothetical protein
LSSQRLLLAHLKVRVYHFNSDKYLQIIIAKILIPNTKLQGLL